MLPLINLRRNIGLLVLLVALASCNSSPPKPQSAQVGINEEGLLQQPCWLTPMENWPTLHCYRMFVREIPDDLNSALISFPVMHFKAASESGKHLSPVLHLGAGGPGAAMYLDSAENMDWLLQNHDDFSVAAGRDLIFIDPRGAGLSKPLLTCDRFVQNVPQRWKQPLKSMQSWEQGDNDFIHCIKQIRADGVNLSFYNSSIVAQDIAKLSAAMNIPRWILFGISYGTIYAQTIVRDFPQLVESMILDSATFTGLKDHDNYKQRLLGPFELLYNYCDQNTACILNPKIAKQQIEKDIWRTFVRLNRQPIQVPTDSVGSVFLTGDRFIEVIIHAVYGEDILSDLPAIIEQLNDDKATTLLPYLENYLAYQLDPTYGDISFYSHYCYETRPFTDHSAIETAIAELEDIGIQAYATASEQWPGYCGVMGIFIANPIEGLPVKTDIPTLFLHGELDPVTPLAEVEDQIKYFNNHQLITFTLSHDIMNSATCAETLTGVFVNEPNSQLDQSICDLSF